MLTIAVITFNSLSLTVNINQLIQGTFFVVVVLDVLIDVYYQRKAVEFNKFNVFRK